MTDEKAQSEDESVVPVSENDQPTEGSTAADAGEMSADELRAAFDKATAEAEAFRDQALRAHAETENVRRRSQRDVENAHKYALEKFAGELLPVVDSFERAVLAAQEQHEADSPEAAVAIVEGVELSLKLLFDALEKSGVKPVDPHGEPFDPQFHEAMGMVESPDAEPGSVLHVVQKGYTLNERLVRAAMVMVAKAPVDASDVDKTA